MVRVLNRALLRETAVNFLATALALVLILSSSRLVRYFSDVAAGELPGDLVAALMGYKLLWALVLIVPVSFFMAVILVLGRWYADSEMTALAAAGIGRAALMKRIAVMATLLAVLVACFSFVVSPWSNEKLAEIEDKAEAGHQLQILRPGQFHHFADGRRVFYVERVLPENQGMSNVFVQMQGGDIPSVLVAKKAHTRIDPRDHGQFLVLTDGYRYDGTPGRADYRLTEYREYGVRIKDQPVARKLRKRDALPSAALWGSADRADVAEMQWRFSAPLQAWILALLAVPLSYTSPRSGRGGRLILAVLLYLIYSNFLSVSQSWLKAGHIPAWIGLWWVHGVMLALLVILLLRDRSGGR